LSLTIGDDNPWMDGAVAPRVKPTPSLLRRMGCRENINIDL
jgi:hypothetical protein